MQSVGQQLGIGNLETFRPHSAFVTPDAIGVELELEGFTSSSTQIATQHLHPLWSVTTDGSLRNGGVEFITAGGLGGERLYAAYERMVSLLDRVNYDASWRCSTHMHINMLDFTVNQVARFMMVYAACEPVLFAHCGQFRRSSNFCTPLGDSIPFHKQLISQLYDTAVADRAGHGVCNKYTAMNFTPLFGDGRTRALGTVEFRGGRPMTTIEDFVTQTNLLLSIKHFVRTFEGNEESMLSHLMNGVLNTVYENGIAAALNVNTHELEEAQVHAWLLLKSYQEGMARPRARRPEIPVGRSLSGGGATPQPITQPPLRDLEAETVSSLVETFSNRGWYSSGRATNAVFQVIHDSPADIIPWSRNSALRLWDYFHEMNLGSTTDKAKHAYLAMTCRDTQFRLSDDQASKALANWMLNLGTRHGEPSSLGTAYRALASRRQYPVNREFIHPLRSLADQPRCRNIIGHRLDYLNVLTHEEKTNIANYMGINVTRVTSSKIFDFLLTTVLTVKAPKTLINSINANCGTVMPHLTSTVVPATWLYFGLRWARRASQQHLSPTSRAMYDRVAAIMDVLFGENRERDHLSVPVMYPSPYRDFDMAWANTPSSGLGYDIGAQRLQRHTQSRTSTVTGLQVY